MPSISSRSAGRICGSCRSNCTRPNSPACCGRPDGIFIAAFESGAIGPDLFRKACDFRSEGIVSKRRDRPYIGGRSNDRLKVKNAVDPAMSREF